MENWWINTYGIGFIVTCVLLLPTFSGIMREQYVWKKTFWTVPYKDKSDRATAYASALFASMIWPVVWAATIIVFVAAFLYACWYHIFKKLR